MQQICTHVYGLRNEYNFLLFFFHVEIICGNFVNSSWFFLLLFPLYKSLWRYVCLCVYMGALCFTVWGNFSCLSFITYSVVSSFCLVLCLFLWIWWDSCGLVRSDFCAGCLCPVASGGWLKLRQAYTRVSWGPWLIGFPWRTSWSGLDWVWCGVAWGMWLLWHSGSPAD